jgi:hypothetical protein
MTNRLGWIAAPVLAMTFVSATAATEGPAVKVARTKTTATRVSGAGSRSTSILGTAWNADSTPVKNANLRLRNVVTGKVEAATKGNDEGQFTFDNVEGGTYVVELVTDTGKVRTIGHVFTIAPGETVATFVRVGTKVPWVNAFFNNTAASVASTAATEGVTAIAATTPCTSPACD